VTAYDKYAIKGFETNGLDYLTKPMSPFRLAITVERLQKRFRSTAQATMSELEPSAPARPLEMRDLVLLRERASFRMVEAGEVCAVEAEADYTHIYLADGGNVFIRKRMNQWEKELPAPPFLKISRRLLLNMPRIKSIVAHNRESAEVQFEGTDKPVTVSRVELRRIRQAPE
jgi:two-component system LytT family response regulator